MFQSINYILRLNKYNKVQFLNYYCLYLEEKATQPYLPL